MIPYAHHTIDEDDIAAVTRVLRSDFLTCGPEVAAFEGAFAAHVGARHAVAVSSGTAALHAACHAVGIGAGDEVVVPSLTFVASANAVLHQGGMPRFADVDPEQLLLDPLRAAEAINPRTRALLTVDYAGHPSRYTELRRLADRHGLSLIADCAHSLGATHGGVPVGSQADIHCFSLHPAKHITTGEGGVAVTDDGLLAERMRRFRSHHMTRDFRERQTSGECDYDVPELGWNYRMTDFQAALGGSQLRKAPAWLAHRQVLAVRYDEALSAVAGVRPLPVAAGVGHAYHLYVVRSPVRDALLAMLRERGIQANVHYPPVHRFSLYRRLCKEVSLPVAEAVAGELLSLPMFGTLEGPDQERVIDVIRTETPRLLERAGGNTART